MPFSRQLFPTSLTAGWATRCRRWPAGRGGVGRARARLRMPAGEQAVMVVGRPGASGSRSRLFISIYAPEHAGHAPRAAAGAPYHGEAVRKQPLLLPGLHGPLVGGPSRAWRRRCRLLSCRHMLQRSLHLNHAHPHRQRLTPRVGRRGRHQPSCQNSKTETRRHQQRLQDSFKPCLPACCRCCCFH